MIAAEDGTGEASRARVRSDWAKFKELGAGSVLDFQRRVNAGNNHGIQKFMTNSTAFNLLFTPCICTIYLAVTKG